MYLRKSLILQSGPIEELRLDFNFHENGNPKPMVIVGKNGSGKSNFLSFVTDALIEIAAKKFVDVAPPNPSGTGHLWHRIIGDPTIRSGSAYELALMEFAHDDQIQLYISKGGKLQRDDVADKVADFDNANWAAEGSVKSVGGPDKMIDAVFRSGCYVSFPSGRQEATYWSGKSKDQDISDFQDRFENYLHKPISVGSTLTDFRTWLVDVLMDCLVDATAVLQLFKTAVNGDQLIASLTQSAHNVSTLGNVNEVLGLILREPSARVVRVGRQARSRKLMVFRGNELLVPGLDGLSAGQAMLLSIFGTILRYADTGAGQQPTQEMRGIVVVDEIDAHLHADLQHDVLPKLIALFPKIQFVLTAHSPLFPLGMEKALGEHNFTLVELPTGTQITAERFSEFLNSFEYLRSTKAFDDHVVERAAAIERPLVLCEGQTDPKYLKTAAELLEFERLNEQVDFDWIGILANGQAKDGGEGKLRQAQKTLENNPSLLRFHTLLLFDCDQNDPEIDRGLLHVRVLGRNDDDAKYEVGIENLLPSAVFECRFYSESRNEKGTKTIVTTDLNKVELCDYLCSEKRDPADFEKFRAELERIEACLFPNG
ncbi:ATP-binding protein [Roseovarius mucosus]|uniref:AAA family ATPase n=1 Tax=Roseovarius mucosus TaxID=215743 RepID=UPI001C5E2518|nr:AAA family ATPase [Roseovarius mucosus]MBW4974953.1 ATP-binding protein [Roseovarius mucosus]